MTNKLVHVNAYTRADGTEVKEHYRNVDVNSTEEEESSYVLQGGIEMNVPAEEVGFSLPEQLGNVGDVMKMAAQVCVSVATQALDTVKEIKSKNLQEVFEDGGFNKTISDMHQAYELSQQVENRLLESLSKAKDQREYSPLYKVYTKQREMNKATHGALQNLDYAIENRDYDTIVSGLEEYGRIQKENQNTIKPMIETEIKPTIPNTEYSSLPQGLVSPKSWDDLLRNVWKSEPAKQKKAINFGMNMIDNLLQSPDANALLDISSSDFKKGNRYINDNGTVVDSVSLLPFDIKDEVRAKLREQLGVEDAKGIIFRPDSTLSTDIKTSQEFRRFVVNNIDLLLDGEIVKGSLKFERENNLNLYLALKRVGVLDTYINQKGEIVSYIFDTYDFNANESSWMIEWAHNVQENGLFKNFYTINVIVVPLDEWKGWLSMRSMFP